MTLRSARPPLPWLVLATLVAVIFASTAPSSLSGPHTASAARIDIGAEIIIDSAEQVPENPVDPDRCIAVAMLQFDHVPDAISYEFRLTDTLNFWDDISLSEPIDNFPAGGIDMVQLGWYMRSADPDKHLFFLSSFSTGQGCGAAEAAFAGRFEIISAEAVTSGPVARFSFTVDENNPLLVHFVGFTSEGEGLDFDWDFNDGAGSTEINPDHLYPEAGVYQVTLTVTDTNGDTDEVTHPVDLGSFSPTAHIEVTRDPGDAFTFTFDAGGSTDPDDNIESYFWDFGDNTMGSGETQTHTYTLSPGGPTEFTVRLDVVDADGNDDTAEVKVNAGLWTVTGRTSELVCGDEASRAGVAVPIDVTGGAGGIIRADNEGRYKLEVLDGDNVRLTAIVERTGTASDLFYPNWQPAERLLEPHGDIDGQDFERCYDPDAPSQVNVRSINKSFLPDSVTVRNGGIVRICQEDDFSFEPFILGQPAFEFGKGRLCGSLVLSNPGSKPLHAELFDGLHPRAFADIVVLPGPAAPGVTTLNSRASAGSNRLDVASNNGFKPGDTVLVDPDGDNPAKYVVDSLGSLILETPLARSYEAGTIVVNFSSPAAGVTFETPQNNDSDDDEADDGQSTNPGGGASVTPTATIPPTPTPVSEVAGAQSIQPPSTGSGGLHDATVSPRAGVIVLSVAVLAAVLGPRRLHGRVR